MNAIKTRFLYYLSDNDNDDIFYIGITKNPKSRLSAHVFNYGKNITMTVFKELNTYMDDCVESYIIRRALDMGFKLKNSLSTLVVDYYQDESPVSLDAFVLSACAFYSLDRCAGIKIMPAINKNLIVTPKVNTVRLQIMISVNEMDVLTKEAAFQQRTIRNLIRKYINDGLNNDQIKSLSVA